MLNIYNQHVDNKDLGETGAHWDTGHNGTMGFPGKPPMGES